MMHAKEIWPNTTCAV